MSRSAKEPRIEIDWAAVRRRMQQAEAALQEALNPSPARARVILEARARALAQAAAPRSSPGPNLDLVLFRLGMERYAIETRYVREVIRFSEVTAIPGTPDFVVGVTSLRGSVLAVMDIRPLFNVARRETTSTSRLLVLGTDTPEFGIIADEAEGHIEIAASDVLDPAAAVGVPQTHLRGVTRDALIVLDGKVMLKDERLYVRTTDRHSEGGQ